MRLMMSSSPPQVELTEVALFIKGQIHLHLYSFLFFIVYVMVLIDAIGLQVEKTSFPFL